MAERVTRGHGALEGFLARRRAAMARALLRDGAAARGVERRLLDVGCGSSPYFLGTLDGWDRTGIDKMVREQEPPPDGVTLLRHDFETDPSLPFDDATFDAVTMLAVFEHIEPAALRPLLADIRRVLRPGGALVLTTPASWTGPILRLLSALRLVSSEEIDEHKDAYDHETIRGYLEAAGFQPDRLRFGRFELGMNLWAVAVR